jgi:hypothetical protein
MVPDAFVHHAVSIPDAVRGVEVATSPEAALVTVEIPRVRVLASDVRILELRVLVAVAAAIIELR